jgi:purine-nucleoside phosphorylase
MLTEHPLDVAVRTALAGLAGVAAPRALFLLGTGAGLLPLRLEQGTRTKLSTIPGVPEAWRGVDLHAGRLGGLACWILEDSPGPPDRGSLPDLDEPPWVRGFPCWLAAEAGAAVLVHASAAASLVPRIQPASLALLSDHVNLSGRTPLVGLSASRLGPLFPDLARLHHADLRKRALEIAGGIGLAVHEGVAAASAGPALETPAERRFFARAGADVVVQGLEGPLLAAAHAGLVALAIACVTDRGEGEVDLMQIVASAERMAPGLEDLLVRLAPEVARVADEQEVEA